VTGPDLQIFLLLVSLHLQKIQDPLNLRYLAMASEELVGESAEREKEDQNQENRQPGDGQRFREGRQLGHLMPPTGDSSDGRT
jgi:hypothetical protein